MYLYLNSAYILRKQIFNLLEIMLLRQLQRLTPIIQQHAAINRLLEISGLLKAPHSARALPGQLKSFR